MKDKLTELSEEWQGICKEAFLGCIYTKDRKIFYGENRMLRAGPCIDGGEYCTEKKLRHLAQKLSPENRKLDGDRDEISQCKNIVEGF